MEFGNYRDVIVMTGLNNQQRLENLHVLEAAETIEEALTNATEYFDSRVNGITAEQVLAEFVDENLHPLAGEGEFFDPALFRAVLLFELPHLIGDDIAFVIPKLRHYWEAAQVEVKYASGAYSFKQIAKNPDSTNISAMDHFVIDLITAGAKDRQIEEVLAREQPKDDSLEESVFGRKGFELMNFPKLPEDPVLTRDLLTDLNRPYPLTVVEELKLRFTSAMGIENVVPLIEQIIEERKDGVLPEESTLVEGYKRSVDQAYEALVGDPSEVEQVTEAELGKEALKRVIYLRSERARTTAGSFFSYLIGEWVTTVSVNPEDGGPSYVKDRYVGTFRTRVRDLTDEEQKILDQKRSMSHNVD